MSHLTLLGPQQRQPLVGSVLDDLGAEGPVALVTAGWQEREGEDGDLAREIRRGPRSGARREVVNLALHARGERLFAEHPELLVRMQERQDRLLEVADLYRRRLDPLLGAARYVLSWPGVSWGDGEIREAERASALGAVRALDRHHAERVERIEAVLRPSVEDFPGLRREREEVHEAIAASSAVVLAGGHLVVLRNRLELFALEELLRDGRRPVVAWSAAAMILGDTIVLFHDRPPQGMGHPEVLARGMGLAPGIVALPDGSGRLRLDDPNRVALLASRFPDRVPLILDDGARLDLDGDRWIRARKLRRLTPEGTVEPVDGAELPGEEG